MSNEKPAGSLEPINVNKGLWTDGLAAADLDQLKALAADINKAVDRTVKEVARGKIRVGRLLLEARSLFHDDIGFGRWRKEHTMVQSKQHAHYLMQVAERFGDAPKLIEGANYSVLQELVLADQKDIEWVQDRIDKGEPPTVKEVRAKVTASKPKPKGATVAVAPPKSPHAQINDIVQMDLSVRIAKVLEHKIKGIEGHLIIIGLDPDPQCPCNDEVLEAIDDYWNGETTPDNHRILRNSIAAVREEFKNWD